MNVSWISEFRVCAPSSHVYPISLVSSFNFWTATNSCLCVCLGLCICRFVFVFSYLFIQNLWFYIEFQFWTMTNFCLCVCVFAFVFSYLFILWLLFWIKFCFVSSFVMYRVSILNSDEIHIPVCVSWLSQQLTQPPDLISRFCQTTETNKREQNKPRQVITFIFDKQYVLNLCFLHPNPRISLSVRLCVRPCPCPCPSLWPKDPMANALSKG